MSPEETGNHSISDCKPYTGKRYYGKYRGTVIGNQDPLLKGRILALVPSVTVFVPSTWIEPCSPSAGFGVGFFAVPPIDASVWVEFIEGDPNYPVWTGGYWDEKDLLAIPPSSRPMIRSGQVMLRILSGITITMDNALGVTIETSIGTKVIVNSSGISIGKGSPATPPLLSGIIIDVAGNISIIGTAVSLVGSNVSITGKVSINGS